MHRALRKALGYIGIALEEAAGGSIAGSVRLLADTHTEVLFQAGYTRIARLQRMLRDYAGTVWLQDRELFGILYPSLWVETAEGLLNKRPRCCAPGGSAQAAEHRDFLCLDDVLAAERAIAAMMAADHIVFHVLGVDRDELMRVCLNQTMLRDQAEITCRLIFTTVLAQQLLTGRAVLQPLHPADVPAFLERLCVYDSRGARLRPGMADATVQWLAASPRFNQNHAAGTASFVQECLAVLEEEFSQLARNKSIDYRFVSGIVLLCPDAQVPEAPQRNVQP
jgi:hypothetical protein